MSAQRRRSKQRRNARKQRTAPPAEFWRAAPEPPEPPDIVPAEHPGALLRSMGAPPLPGQRTEASLGYLQAVVHQAAKIASAVAASADLLGSDDDEDGAGTGS